MLFRCYIRKPNILIKLVSEEVSFKASFEGVEGKSLTESEGREFKISAAEKQKARPPFSFGGVS